MAKKYEPTLTKTDSTKHVMEWVSWPKVPKGDAEAYRKRFLDYIAYCNENEIMCGNLSACLAMGITNDLLCKWKNGYCSRDLQELAEFIYSVCASAREIAMGEGGMNPVTGIWWQKNHDGFVDNAKVELEYKQVEEKPSIESIKARYALDSTQATVRLPDRAEVIEVPCEAVDD